MAEWFKAAVLKTVVPLAGTVGSNPTPSATASGGAEVVGAKAVLPRPEERCESG